MKMTSWERNLTKKASREKNGGGDRKDTTRKGCWGGAKRGQAGSPGLLYADRS